MGIGETPRKPTRIARRASAGAVREPATLARCEPVVSSRRCAAVPGCRLVR